MDIKQQARNLLAAEYRKQGKETWAKGIEEHDHCESDECALRAIAAALQTAKLNKREKVASRMMAAWRIASPDFAHTHLAVDALLDADALLDRLEKTS